MKLVSQKDWENKNEKPSGPRALEGLQEIITFLTSSIVKELLIKQFGVLLTYLALSKNLD